jgi:hypothetical protein
MDNTEVGPFPEKYPHLLHFFVCHIVGQNLSGGLFGALLHLPHLRTLGL